MYHYDNAICHRIKTLAAESENYINLIYATPCIYTRNMLLYQLRVKINEIDFISGTICCQMNQMQVSPTALQQQNQQNQHSQRDLTLQELSKFNGKDGNPAYVAVNGTVYDITNNAAWAAASHFGLTAGKDLTSEFASCHAGQPILSKLKVVGKLI
ncbi:MAG TPA: cytochrome b5 domain-containing protein [Pseudobacteroides sp.]|uniref:cytochrome b5 domain-containing protein n=1 Tax=Pseudobacteroides sp. TaxID=1968840 RepID=UPI002F93775A